MGDPERKILTINSKTYMSKFVYECQKYVKA